MSKPRTGAGNAPAPKRRKSGRTLTEAERTKLGYKSLKLRLPDQTILLLGILADEANMSRAEYVHELIEAADLEHARANARLAHPKDPTDGK